MVAIAPDPKRPMSFFLYLLASMIYGKRRVRCFSAKPRARVMSELTAYVESSVIRPIVDSVYPPLEIAAAHRALEKGGRCGKQVVRIASRLRN